MISSQEACRQRVYIRTKKGRLRKFGRIRAVVFHPNKAQAVGYIIKRPDLLWMFKRKDRFVAADCVTPVEGGWEILEQSGTYDGAACRRLEIDYDECIIWEGMPVQSEDGRELGTIAAVFYDEETLNIDRIDLSTGSVARKLLGEADITREDIVGYGGGAIVVRERVKEVEEAGGVAAQAGEAWAVTKHTASVKVEEGKQAAAETAHKAGQAVDRGAEAAGKAVGSANRAVADALDRHEAKKEAEQASGKVTGVDKAANSVGKQLGRASRMFSDFKSEYDKAAGKK